MKLHSKRVEKMLNYTRNEWRRCEKYTPNEWRRFKGSSGLTSLFMTVNSRTMLSVVLVNSRKQHSERVEKMRIYTRNEWRRCEATLGTSGEDPNRWDDGRSYEGGWLDNRMHGKGSLPTRLECIF